jgi:hypothetical protein
MFRAKALTPDEMPSLETSNSPYIFSSSCIPTNEKLVHFIGIPALAKTVQHKKYAVLSSSHITFASTPPLSATIGNTAIITNASFHK